MSDRTSFEDESSATARDRTVDRVCDKFEAKWTSGDRPRIEAYLRRVPRSARASLFRELLILDLAYRAQSGEQPQPEEYHLRFPRRRRSIDRAFAESARLPAPFPRLGILTNWATDALARHRADTPFKSQQESSQLEGSPNQIRSPEGPSLGKASDFDEVSRSRPAGAFSEPKSQGTESDRVTLLGDYALLEKLGKGGMGVVYRARQVSADRIVALKIIRPDKLDELVPAKRQEWLERFRREAKVAARIQSDDVVTVYEVGEIAGEHFYSMRYVDGGSLAELIHNGPLDSRRAAKYLQKMASAVAAVHAVGIVHRDIKPRNILIDGNDRPYLSDFGLAKWADGRDGMTETGACLGSPSYMAPEQAQRPAAASSASDVYSLGASLYESLTGRPPFCAADTAETVRQLVSDEPVPPRRLNPAIQRDLELICLKCLQKEPKARYQTARQLADELQRFLDGEPLRHTRAVSRTARLIRWSRRNPALASSCAGVALLFFAVTIVSVLYAAHRSRASADLAKANLETTRQAAHWALDWGLNLCERGECDRGMTWLARALEVVPAEANDLQWTIRSNLAGWQSQTNVLRTYRRVSGSVMAVTFGTNHPRALVLRENGNAQLWDVAEGELIGVPLKHEADVSSAMFCADGGIVVTATKDGAARAWNADTGEPIGPPVRHRGAIHALACSFDGKIMITGSEDRTAQVWDAPTGQRIAQRLQHEDAVFALALSPDGKTVATGTKDGSAHLWGSATGHHIGSPMRVSGSVMTVEFSPVGNTVVTCSTNGIARSWDAATGKPVSAPIAHEGSVRTIAFSPDGKTALTAGADKTARLWANSTGELIGTPLLHDGEVLAVKFSADGRKFLTSSSGGTVRIWQTASRSLLGSQLRHSDAVRLVEFSHDGQSVLTASADKTIRLWDLASGKPIKASLPHRDAVHAVAYSFDGKKILTADFTGLLQLWDTATGKRLGQLQHGPKVSAAAFSPDGETVVTGSADGTAQLWDANTGERRCAPLSHEGWVCAVAFSPDSKRVMTASVDGNVRIWEAPIGKALVVLHHPRAVLAATFSPGGDKILTASADNAARLWDSRTGAQLGRPLPHRDQVIAVAFSPDGSRCVTASDDNTAQVWETATGCPVGQPLRHGGPLHGVALSPDGQIVITASDDKTAQLWRTATGERLGSPLQHQGPVYAVAYSPTGRVVATASADGSARLWDTETCTPIGPRLLHRYGVDRVVFSPDGRTVLTGSSDQTAGLWEVPPPLEGSVQQISLWTQLCGGIELLDAGAYRELDAETWRERQSQLQEVGGPPGK
jgi:WD40 repeat protein/predicted Ser/Thr protein kinase